MHTLREDGRAELTVLLLGRGGAGKSSTVNSLLGERAANVAAFQQDAARPICFSREVGRDRGRTRGHARGKHKRLGSRGGPPLAAATAAAAGAMP